MFKESERIESLKDTEQIGAKAMSGRTAESSGEGFKAGESTSHSSSSVFGETLKGIDMLSHEEIDAEIYKCGLGFTKSDVDNFADNLKSNIDARCNSGANTLKINTKRSKESEESYVGRKIFNTAKTMINCSSILFKILCTHNYNLEEKKQQLREANQEKEAEISRLENEAVKTGVSSARIVQDTERKIQQECYERGLPIKQKFRVEYEENKTAFINSAAKKKGHTRASSSDNESDDVYPDWIKSNEKLTMEYELNELKLEIEYKYSKAVDKEMEDYDSEIKIKDKNALRLNVLKEELKIDSRRATLIDALAFGVGHIASKLKLLVKDYSGIVQKLQTRVTLPNGEVINDPYNNDSVCGMYYKMFKEYNKANLVNFAEQMFYLFTYQASKEESDNDPVAVAFTVEQYFNIWQSSEIFKYMTIDNLFTVALLRAYHPNSETHKRLLIRGLEYIGDLEKKIIEGEVILDPKEMTVFNYLQENVIRNEISKSKEFTKIGKEKDTSKSENVSTGKPKSDNGKSKRVFETARVALCAPNSDGKYTGCVTRDMQCWKQSSRDPSHNVLYLATEKPCPKCSSSEKSQWHEPKCNLAQCHTCKLFGHFKNGCKQCLPLDGKSAEIADVSPK